MTPASEFGLVAAFCEHLGLGIKASGLVNQSELALPEHLAGEVAELIPVQLAVQSSEPIQISQLLYDNSQAYCG